MPIFDSIFLSLPCPGCGSPQEIPLRTIGLAQSMHEGCPASWARECPELYWQDLIDPAALQDFIDAWNRLEASAAASGGSLTMRSGPESTVTASPPA